MTWTPEQDAILKERYGKEPNRELAERLGISTDALRYRAFKAGLPPKVCWQKPKPSQWPRLKQMMPGLMATAAKVYSPEKVAKIHGVTVDEVMEAIRSEAHLR